MCAAITGRGRAGAGRDLTCFESQPLSSFIPAMCVPQGCVEVACSVSFLTCAVQEYMPGGTLQQLVLKAATGQVGLNRG